MSSGIPVEQLQSMDVTIFTKFLLFNFRDYLYLYELIRRGAPPVPPFVQDVVPLLGHLEVSTCLFVDILEACLA